MRIAIDCRYSINPPPRLSWDDDGTIACCRADGRFSLLGDDEEPLCRSMRTETEVCRFTWRSSFDVSTVTRSCTSGGRVARSRPMRLFALPCSGTPITGRCS